MFASNRTSAGSSDDEDDELMGMERCCWMGIDSEVMSISPWSMPWYTTAVRLDRIPPPLTARVRKVS